MQQTKNFFKNFRRIFAEDRLADAGAAQRWRFAAGEL